MTIAHILVSDYAVSIGIFLGLLIAFEGARQIIARRESDGEARSRRMRLIARNATTEERLRLLKPRPDAWALARLPLIGGLPMMLRQSGLTSVRPGVFLAACLSLGVALAALASVLLPPVLAALLAVMVGLVIPVTVVRKKSRARHEQLLKQLPDALDLMARGLLVGHPLNATIASVASDMPDPIASEFGVMLDQVSYGDDLVNAFADLAERLPLEDVRYLSVSVAIQHGTGGDLAQVLNTLAKVIRDRMQMRRKIKAISAEGRLTSVFLSSLPLFILAGTMISVPSYYRDVSDDPLFRPFAIVVAVLVVSNYVVMRRLVNFRF
jgi:tight adherence protein B